MSNVRFITTKLDVITFSSSGGDDASYPAVNLNTGYHDDLWKSANSTSNQFIAMDMGADVRKRTGIVLHNHNLNGIAPTGIKLQGAANSGFSSGVVDAVYPLEPVTDPYFLDFGGAAVKQYWRLLFLGTLGAVPQIGQVFVDEALDLGTTYSLPNDPGNDEFQVSRSIALDGRIRTSSPFGGRKTFKFSFRDGNALSETVRVNWQKLFALAGGSLRPVYFIDADDAIYLVHLDFDRDTLFRFRYNMYPLEVTIKSQRVS